MLCLVELLKLLFFIFHFMFSIVVLHISQDTQSIINCSRYSLQTLWIQLVHKQSNVLFWQEMRLSSPAHSCCTAQTQRILATAGAFRLNEGAISTASAKLIRIHCIFTVGDLLESTSSFSSFMLTKALVYISRAETTLFLSHTDNIISLPISQRFD